MICFSYFSISSLSNNSANFIVIGYTLYFYEHAVLAEIKLTLRIRGWGLILVDIVEIIFSIIIELFLWLLFILFLFIILVGMNFIRRKFERNLWPQIVSRCRAIHSYMFVKDIIMWSLLVDFLPCQLTHTPLSATRYIQPWGTTRVILTLGGFHSTSHAIQFVAHIDRGHTSNRQIYFNLTLFL